jgi:tetratricopeptide (TPR) repeat protein
MPQKAIAQALQHHRLGQLQTAERIYREVLRVYPNNPDALHLLGLLAHQVGQQETALDLVCRAVAINPRAAIYNSNLGMIYRSFRRIDQAAACFRRAVELNPNFVDALEGLGLCLQEQGNLAEARGCYHGVLKLQPDSAATHNNLGTICAASGDQVGAEACYRRAIAFMPQLAEAHYNLGDALRRQGRAEEAMSCYRRAVELAPSYAQALNSLGAMLNERGNLPEAIACFHRALQALPDFPEAHHNLSLALREQGRDAEALAHSQLALAIRPEFAEAHNSRGMILQEQGNLEQAAESYRRALELNPGLVHAQNNLGHVLVALGRVEEGISQFRQAIEKDPESADALYALAINGRRWLDQPTVARMDAMLADQGRSIKDRALIGFALAHLKDRSGDYDQAFDYCRQGNALKKAFLESRGVRFDAAANIAYVDRLIATFTDFFARWKSVGCDDGRPVFVVGMPRSGTTLVEQILASHRDVWGAGELEDVGHLASRLSGLFGSSQPYPGCLTEASSEVLRTEADGYLRRLDALGGKSSRVIDKMPLNFLHLGLIATLFPRARVIHCRRDPYDVSLSCLMQNFQNAGLCFTFDAGHLAAFYRQYERLMEHWRAVLPCSMFEIRYEHLVDNQEELTRKLVDFCGLSWDPGCLAFHQNPRTVTTASVLDVRTPIYTRSVGRWKNYRRHLQPLIEALATAAQSSTTGEVGLV